MPTIEEIQRWPGAEVVDNDGDKIGKLDHVYQDRETGEPTFGAVKTGLFGSKLSLVPIQQATLVGDDVKIPFDKQAVSDAPKVEADGELSEQEEQQLYEHYKLSHSPYEGRDYDYDQSRGTTGTVDTVGTGDRVGNEHGTVGHDTSGPTTDDAMTRSEEELRVGKETRETGRARLRKYVTTEDVHTTVPVSREEVRIEREPITDANVGDAYDGPAISEEEHEVTLHEERPVVQKDVVAKERVRLEKDVVTDEVEVNETVRKENIEQVDGTDAPADGIDGRRGTDGGA
jgi:uncharacterized protein (TIGR02271 family)